MRRQKNRKILVVFLCLFLVVCIYFRRDVSRKRTPPPRVEVIGDDDAIHNRKEKVEPKSTGTICNIPKLDINGSEVISFFVPPDPLPCEENDPNWVSINENSEFVFAAGREEADCSIEYITRVAEYENQHSDPKTIKSGEIMESEFGYVSCSMGFLTKWYGYLMTVKESSKVRQRLQNIKRLPDASGLDVFILSMDSLSQMAFRRNLPKTVKTLEDVYGAIILNGYNIVGDGTPQAFIPVLTAGTEEELPLTRRRFPEANYLDDVYPMIWNNFSDSGYVTLFGEDSYEWGMFSFRLKGFRNQPTDHYPRTVYKTVENLYDSHKVYSDNSNKCAGSVPIYESWFEYARRFMSLYSGLPKFSLMHQTLLSHDSINLVQTQDDYLANYLREMRISGLLDNSILIVMADHGNRFAKVRETHQGQLEERLPFVSIALPEKFKRTSSGRVAEKNLKTNRDRLSTPFDLHATLWDILHWPSVKELENEQSADKRSLSLLRPIPVDRSCDQAGAAPHWCTCLNWEDALSNKEDEEKTRQLAEILVDAINKQMKDVKHLCAILKLSEIRDAKKLVPNSNLLKYTNVLDADGFVPDLRGQASEAFIHYQLKIVTMPGGAIYEATLFNDLVKNLVQIDLASISHVNKYGDAPHCIINQNYFLAKYCVCFDKV